jgi:hypothetical protein
LRPNKPGFARQLARDFFDNARMEPPIDDPYDRDNENRNYGE